MEKFALIPRLHFCEDSLWEDYADLVAKYKPLNLGLYHPDFMPPQFILDALNNVLKSTDPNLHQYTKSNGHPRLVNILAKLYAKLINRTIDPKTEILTTLGASEGLSCAILSLINTGDEVIIIEPFFGPYEALVNIAGGIPKFTALKNKSKPGQLSTSADWILDQKELENLFSSKTKAIILNTPNNPLGKVFDLSEIMFIANLCNKWNVICISDEVYEWMVYEPKEHIRIASLPGMWQRTVTIGSAGKTFCITGWKVGWVYGSSQLIKSLQMLHQTTVFTGCTPLEEAIAMVFEEQFPHFDKKISYFRRLARDLKSKRDCIVQILTDAQFKPVIPDAGAFLIADWSKLATCADLNSEADIYEDFRFTKWLTKNVKLLGIPVTPFYIDEDKKLVEKFVRFCFIGKLESLEKAEEVLNKIKE